MILVSVQVIFTTVFGGKGKPGLLGGSPSASIHLARQTVYMFLSNAQKTACHIYIAPVRIIIHKRRPHHRHTKIYIPLLKSLATGLSRLYYF